MAFLNMTFFSAIERSRVKEHDMFMFVVRAAVMDINPSETNHK